jgi:hypothetical protein
MIRIDYAEIMLKGIDGPPVYPDQLLFLEIFLNIFFHKKLGAANNMNYKFVCGIGKFITCNIL